MQTTSDMLRSDIDHVVPEELHAIYREESEDHIGSIYSGLNELQLEIGAGEVFGFLGPNGSGKTTTLSILLGVIGPSSGIGSANLSGAAAS